jgi:hypothetical protein
MRFPLFFARYLVGIYAIVTVLLLIIAFVDLFVGVLNGHYKSDKHAVTFSRRISTVAFWPILLFSAKGRKMIFNLWRNILV